MPQPSEFDLQRALCLWLDGNPDKDGRPRMQPALAPDVVYFHPPNGGVRDLREAKRLKQSGVKAGVHDLLFLRPTQFESGIWGLLFGMELKEPGGSQPPERHLSKSQQSMHPRLMRAGMAASIVTDNLVDAKTWLILHSLAVGVDIQRLVR
jgi:hypothetical protein